MTGKAVLWKSDLIKIDFERKGNIWELWKQQHGKSFQKCYFHNFFGILLIFSLDFLAQVSLKVAVECQEVACAEVSLFESGDYFHRGTTEILLKTSELRFF